MPEPTSVLTHTPAVAAGLPGFVPRGQRVSLLEMKKGFEAIGRDDDGMSEPIGDDDGATVTDLSTVLNSILLGMQRLEHRMADVLTALAAKDAPAPAEAGGPADSPEPAQPAVDGLEPEEGGPPASSELGGESSATPWPSGPHAGKILKPEAGQSVDDFREEYGLAGGDFDLWLASQGRHLYAVEQYRRNFDDPSWEHLLPTLTA